MKNVFQNSYIALIIAILVLVFATNCSKDENPVKYPNGIFPDTIINLQGLNSPFDDYNSTDYAIPGALSLVFSSNRKSSGGQFDLEQGLITFNFHQTDGSFDLSSGMTQDAYLSRLIETAVTPRNDYGPYRAYSSYDGLEYLILASENADENLDLMYCKNTPEYGSGIPVIDGPFPVNLLNTTFDDAYLSLDLNQDSAYFTSNINGNFDIFVQTRPAGEDIGAWFNSAYTSSQAVESINSSSDDKCPMIYNKFMVFTSNRPGGYGGYDLYYSLFKNGQWSAPVNFGTSINTSSDEYRPLIGFYTGYSNIYMIFSSDRPGGSGGFDLYFTGIEVPE